MSLIISISAALILTTASVSAANWRVSASAAPEYDAAFANTRGWIGADGDYSVQLDGNRVLWLFSDTFVGKVSDGKRVDSKMINNSVAIQRLGVKDSVTFFYNTGQSYAPKSFITPDDGQGYFWLFDGALTSKGLYFFLLRVKHLDAPGGFPFTLTGMSLAHVPNPTDSPDKWKITQCRVPFSRFTQEGDILFGSATLKAGGHIYIYGVSSMHKDDKGGPISRMIVARVREDRFGDFSAWRFWSGGKWGYGFERSDGLISGIPTEFSVSYVPGISQYALVYTEGGIYGNIMVRLSPKPEGPWGEPMKVYDCPDKAWHKAAYCYAAKAHPELSRSPNELMVSYACNSMEFADLFSDARLYWPRFVRLTFGKP